MGEGQAHHSLKTFAAAVLQQEGVLSSATPVLAWGVFAMRPCVQSNAGVIQTSHALTS